MTELLASLLVIAAVGTGTAAQTLTGFGLVLVCGPLLVAVLGPADGVRLAVVVSLVLNVALLTRRWRQVRVRDAGRLFLPAALVTPPVAAWAGGVDTRIAVGTAGAAVVLGAGALALGCRWRWLTTRTGTLLTGAVSGAMNAFSATGGPAAALYAANTGWSARTAAATLQAYFAGANVVALAVLGLPSRLTLLLPASAGLILGMVAGLPLAHRVSPTTARRLVLAMAAAGGLGVLVPAAIGPH